MSIGHQRTGWGARRGRRRISWAVPKWTDAGVCRPMPEWRRFSRGHALWWRLTSLHLCRSEADDQNLSSATGVVQVGSWRFTYWGLWELILVTSSRLAARAAARSWSRSSSCNRRSTTCCSSTTICCLSWSISVGAPSPDSCQVCLPSNTVAGPPALECDFVYTVSPVPGFRSHSVVLIDSTTQYPHQLRVNRHTSRENR